MVTNQDPCVLNGGITTKYFKLKKGKRQGNPISAYLFILVLEIVFLMIKTNQPPKIFGHDFLYTAYADETTFLIRNKNSIMEPLNVFDIFSVISGLKTNKSKCETAGISNLKGVHIALRGLKCINLVN